MAKKKAANTNALKDLFLKHPKKLFNYKQVSKHLGITKTSDRLKITGQLDRLLEQGFLEQAERGKFRLKNTFVQVEGRVERIRSGAAFVMVENSEDDIFIPKQFCLNALSGDIVKVALSVHQNNNKRPEGSIIEVVKRSKTHFSGVFKRNKTWGFVLTDDSKMPYDIYIPAKELKKVEDGDKVLVEITDWPQSPDDSPVGTIIEVFGKVGENEAEIHAILSEFELPRRFPDHIELLASKINREISQEEIQKRRDFRGITTFTIDPDDAKDFDDALSIEKDKDGHWEIGIHIADVSHYVIPKTELDKEAYDRATSIYLVDRVVPMLPEVLSNGLCSLRPGEEKLCFSAVFKIDDTAKVLNKWFGRTIIKSDRRFTYDEAQQRIETGEGDFAEEINLLNGLAKILRANRMAEGSIAFEREEVKFILDENSQPDSVFFKMQKESNKLIEEFMLLANKNVAKFLSENAPKQGSNEKYGVYRVHDKPALEKIADFSLFVKKLGYDFNHDGKTRQIAGAFNQVLSGVQGKPEANLVETLAIRTMTKAYYTTENIGHYGLGFDFYTHFTSPIRRYPDVIVHRLLQLKLDGAPFPPRKTTEESCKHASKMEKLAEEAERASIKFMQVKFLQDKIGQHFTGIVSGVTEFGLFVQLEENKCEGMIRLKDIAGDYYRFDEKNYMVVGNRTGKQIRLGDEFEVRLKSANLFNKQIDLEYIG